MVLRFGALVEGCDDSELPEQMLISVCMNRVDIDRVRAVDPVVAAFLVDPVNRDLKFVTCIELLEHR